MPILFEERDSISSFTHTKNLTEKLTIVISTYIYFFSLFADM